MKRAIVTMIAGIVMLGSASAVAAQGRDRAERGQRLEVDELRNDVRQDRLKKSRDSGLLPQAVPQQSEPGSDTDRKSKRSKKQR